METPIQTPYFYIPVSGCGHFQDLQVRFSFVLMPPYADTRNEITFASEYRVLIDHLNLFQCLFVFVLFYFVFSHTHLVTSKHHLSFLLVTEIQYRQINSIAKH